MKPWNLGTNGTLIPKGFLTVARQFIGGKKGRRCKIPSAEGTADRPGGLKPAGYSATSTGLKSWHFHSSLQDFDYRNAAPLPANKLAGYCQVSFQDFDYRNAASLPANKLAGYCQMSLQDFDYRNAASSPANKLAGYCQMSFQDKLYRRMPSSFQCPPNVHFMSRAQRANDNLNVQPPGRQKGTDV